MNVDFIDNLDIIMIFINMKFLILDYFVVVFEKVWLIECGVLVGYIDILVRVDMFKLVVVIVMVDGNLYLVGDDCVEFFI